MGRILLYGFHFFLAGIFFYILYFLAFVLTLLKVNFPLTNNLIFAANIFAFIAFIAVFVDLFIPTIFFPHKKKFKFEPIKNPQISIGMTAYNDEKAIGRAVKDFKQLKEVEKIIVIDNNCIDNTALEAKKAGAIVVKESTQGYGAACIRALKEARKYGNLICLVEGDCTYSSADLKKLVAYIENVDIVVGTRTTEELVNSDSQVTPFIRYGNLFLSKLIQLRYWDKLRLTDVGTTFRVIRPEALDKIINQLTVTGNSFSPHMILIALKNDLRVIEIPITFKKRIGESKGVGSDIIKGLKTGFEMWALILLH